MSVKVVKFGGSSLADANQFIKVANIIGSDPSRKYVVPSAPGKRYPKDTKVTDMLYACYDVAARGGDFSEMFEEIVARYMGIIRDLGLRDISYLPLSAYGHMGREDLKVSWEKTDRVEALLDALK